MSARAVWRAMCRGCSAAVAQRCRFVMLTAAAALLLAAAGFLHLGRAHVDRVASGVRTAEMIVFLEEGASDSERDRVARLLGSVGAVEEVRYVSPEEAMARSDSLLGGQPLLEGIEPSFFPAAFEVSLPGGAADVAAVHPMISELQAAPGVESVEFLGDWVGRIGAAVAGVRRVSTTVAVIAALLAVIVLVALVRVAGFARNLQSVMLSVGSPRWMARVPGISCGALFGVCSGLAAVGLIALAYRHVAPRMDGALGEIFGAPGMPFLGAGQLVVLIGICAAAGAIGGGFGVERAPGH